jgi:hypothetical protein
MLNLERALERVNVGVLAWRMPAEISDCVVKIPSHPMKAALGGRHRRSREKKTQRLQAISAITLGSTNARTCGNEAVEKVVVGVAGVSIRREPRKCPWAIQD